MIPGASILAVLMIVNIVGSFVSACIKLHRHRKDTPLTDANDEMNEALARALEDREHPTAALQMASRS